MNNELISHKSWIQKNWIKITISCFLAILIFIILLSSNSKNGLTDTINAFKENSLYEKALDHANSNSAVLETIGKINSIDKLAILEGNTSYTNNGNEVIVSVRIKGSKKQGKLEFQATKNGSEWNYKKISIRVKSTNEEITILDNKKLY